MHRDDEVLLDEALGAFFAVIRDEYPDATSGDMEPGVLVPFESQARAAMLHWIEMNAPRDSLESESESDWREAVADGSTTLGYAEWCEEQSASSTPYTVTVTETISYLVDVAADDEDEALDRAEQILLETEDRYNALQGTLEMRTMGVKLV